MVVGTELGWLCVRQVPYLFWYCLNPDHFFYYMIMAYDKKTNSLIHFMLLKIKFHLYTAWWLKVSLLKKITRRDQGDQSKGWNTCIACGGPWFNPCPYTAGYGPKTTPKDSISLWDSCYTFYFQLNSDYTCSHCKWSCNYYKSNNLQSAIRINY